MEGVTVELAEILKALERTNRWRFCPVAGGTEVSGDIAPAP